MIRITNAFAAMLLILICASFTLELAAQTARTADDFLLKFDTSTIREIAGKQPRFAATLANFNRRGGLTSKWSKTYWLPVEITQQEIEWWLIPEKESTGFFREFNSRKPVSQIQNTSESIIYEVTVAEASKSDQATLRLEVVNNSYMIDPPYTLLEMELVAAGETNTGKKVWAVKDWRLR